LNRPAFSFFGSCNRPRLWPLVFAALEKNDIDFEVICCGDVAPEFELPHYARWIHATVKPTQCAEIAMRQCSGILMSLLVDDLEYSPGCLDEAWRVYQDSDYPWPIITPMYYNPFDYPGQSAEELTRWAQRFDTRDVNSPPVPLQGFIPAHVVHAIGGFDRRFIAVQNDVDWFMRAQARGARVTVLRHGFATERQDWAGPGATLSNRYHWQHDRPLVESMWKRSSDVPFGWERTSPLEPFEAADRYQNEGAV
jgi:hypothetical protein